MWGYNIQTNNRQNQGNSGMRKGLSDNTVFQNYARVLLPDPIIPSGTLKKCKVTHVYGPYLTIYVLPEDSQDKIDKLSKRMEDLGEDDYYRVKLPKSNMLVKLKEGDKWFRGSVIQHGGATLLVDEGRVVLNADRKLYFIDRFPELIKVPKCAIKCMIGQTQSSLSLESQDLIRRTIIGKEYFVYFESLLEDKYKVLLHEAFSPFDPEALFTTRAETVQSFVRGTTLRVVNIKPGSKEGTFTARLASSKQVLSKMEREARRIVKDFKHKLKFDSFTLTSGTSVMLVGDNKPFTRGIVKQETSDGVRVEVEKLDHVKTSGERIEELFPLIKPFDQIPPQAVTFTCISGLTIPEIDDRDEIEVMISKVMSSNVVEISSLELLSCKKDKINDREDEVPKKKKKSKKKKNVNGDKEEENTNDRDLSEESNGSVEKENNVNPCAEKVAQTEEKKKVKDKVSTTIHFDRNVPSYFELMRTEKDLSSGSDFNNSVHDSCIGPPATEPVLSVVSGGHSSVFDGDRNQASAEGDTILPSTRTGVTEVLDDIESNDENRVTIDLSNIDLDETVLVSYSQGKKSVIKNHDYRLKQINETIVSEEAVMDVERETEVQGDFPTTVGNLIDLSF
jgi:hypothetical protein